MDENGNLDEEKVARLTEKDGDAKLLTDPKEKIKKYMENREEELEKGETIPRQVCKDIRTSVLGEHTIIGSWENEQAGTIEIFHEDESAVINYYYLEPVGENGNPITLPPVVKDWLDRKMKLTPVNV
jgi:hypothetical protein